MNERISWKGFTGISPEATAFWKTVLQGRHVRFFTVKALVTHLIEMTEQRPLERTLRHLERQDILILDELGYVPFSKTGAELLSEVISRAYERRSLIVTTNLPFESWTEVFGSERLTEALLDRLTHRVHILEANGPSYRLRESNHRRAPRYWPQDTIIPRPTQEKASSRLHTATFITADPLPLRGLGTRNIGRR